MKYVTEKQIAEASEPGAINPPVLLESQVMALKAVAAGEADPAQQRKAIEVITHVLSGAYDQSFRPGQPDHMAFAEGRRFVGLQILKFVNTPVKNLYVRRDPHRPVSG